MNLSSLKIGAFFLTVFILGWFLYPRQFFLAYIYEGQADLTKAENFYLDYLENNPFDKTATQRLAQLYERMADPHKALTYLDRVYQHRFRDWDFAQYYIQFAEQVGEQDLGYKLRIELIKRSLADPRVKESDKRSWVDNTLQMALWRNDTETVKLILNSAKVYLRDASEYSGIQLRLYQSQRDLTGLRRFLAERLKIRPSDEQARLDLIRVELELKSFDDAFALARQGLGTSPNNHSFLEVFLEAADGSKRHAEALWAVEQLLTHSQTQPYQTQNLKLRKVVFLESLGHRDQAERVLQELLSQSPQDQTLWTRLLGFYIDAKNFERWKTTAFRALQRFPDYDRLTKELSDYLLYEEKNFNHLKLFEKNVSRLGGEPFALDVVYALIESNQPPLFIRWAEFGIKRFGLNDRWARFLLDHWLKTKQLEKADQLVDRYLDRHPNDLKWIRQSLDLCYQLNNEAKLKKRLISLLKVDSENRETLQFVAQELLGLGFFVDSLKAIQKLEPRLNAITSFIKFENLAALLRTREAQEAARKSLDLHQRQKIDDAEFLRRTLRLQSFLDPNRSYWKEYEQAVKNFPNSHSLIIDFIGSLIDAKKRTHARRQIKKNKSWLSQNAEVWHSLNARLSLVQKNYRQAQWHLEELQKGRRLNTYERVDWAISQERQGEWPNALTEMKQLERSGEAGQKASQSWIDLWTERYHDFSQGRFEFRNLASDLSLWSSSKNRWALSRKLRLIGDADWVYTKLNTLPSSSQGFRARLGLSTLWSHNLESSFAVLGTSLDGDPDWGAHVSSLWRPSDRSELKIEASWKDMIPDLPLAQTEKARQNQVQIQAYQNLPLRFAFGLRSRLSQTTLEGLSPAETWEFAPSLSFEARRKNPQVQVTYEFSFSKTWADTAFLARLPLLQETQTHLWSADVTHKFRSGWSVVLGGYIGQDSIRDLDLVQGELWGVQTRIEMKLGKNWTLQAQYLFENQTSAGGSRSKSCRLIANCTIF